MTTASERRAHYHPLPEDLLVPVPEEEQLQLIAFVLQFDEVLQRVERCLSFSCHRFGLPERRLQDAGRALLRRRSWARRQLPISWSALPREGNADGDATSNSNPAPVSLDQSDRSWTDPLAPDAHCRSTKGTTGLFAHPSVGLVRTY